MKTKRSLWILEFILLVMPLTVLGQSKIEAPINQRLKEIDIREAQDSNPTQSGWEQTRLEGQTPTEILSNTVDVFMSPGETKSLTNVYISGARFGQQYTDTILEIPSFMTFNTDAVYVTTSTRVDFTLEAAGNAPAGSHTIKVEYNWYSGGTFNGSDTLTINLTIGDPPTVTLISPNGGEIWTATTIQSITWTSTSYLPNVKLEYSTDNGTSWTTINSYTPNDGEYSWWVPEVPSTNCLVRVSDVDGNPTDQSNGTFTIVPPTITLTSPNGGEVWEENTFHNITWISTGTITNVRLDISTDNGATWGTFNSSTANDGTYEWQVGHYISNQCLIRVQDAADFKPADASDAVFSIVPQQRLTLYSPNGNERWTGGTTQNITWTSTGAVPNVKLEYSTNNGSNWTTIVASTANDGTEAWTIPNEPSTQCLVRISDAADGTPSDVSNGVFTILPLPTVTLTSPNGGESWGVGQYKTITWTWGGSFATVKLEYSTNNGSSWTTIVANTSNDGSHGWTIPNEPSTQCLVRISEVGTGTPSDVSDAVFSIIPLKPTISLNPAAFQFTATQGGSNPSSQTMTVSNTGSSMLNWSATDNANWLTLSPTSGSVSVGSNQNVTLSINITGLTAGTYNATITVTDPNATNSPQTAPVTLIITSSPKPTISLSPTTFQFTATQGGSNPSTQTLNIGNSGNSTLNWSATDNTSWLTLSPTSGSIAAGSNQNVTLSVNIAGLSVGTYNTTITVTDPNATNSPQTAAVTLVITSSPKPTISLNPTTFQFTATQSGGNPPVQSLNISNTGASGSTLNWNATENVTWLTLSLASGSLSAGANQNVVLSVNIAGLAVGTYNATITVTDPNATNSPQTAVVTLVIQATPKPAITLSPTTFQFTATQGGSNPSAQTLSIGNSGTSTLNWSATDNANWLTLSSTSGSIAASSNQNVTLSVNIAGLAVGTYNATITVTDPNATNSPQTAAVTLVITSSPKPTISLSPTTFQFTATQGGSNSSAQTLSIGNSGTSTLNWSAADNASWLTLSPTSGSVSVGGNQNVTLSVNIAGLAVGTYNATITVTDPNATNSPQTATVTLTIQQPAPKPTIALNPTTFQFTATQGGSNPVAQTLNVSNTGVSGNTLNWSATDNATWLTLSPASGSISAGGSQNVTLSVNSAGLAVGTYNATITVTDPNATNSPQTASVVLNVTLSGSYFVDSGINLTPMRSGTGCWGDYDNDGDLDILMTGLRDNNFYAMIYRNNGNVTFTNLNAALAPVAYGNASWGDYDHDGDLDILLAGWDNTKDLLHVYRNAGNGSFVKLSQELKPVGYMAAEWGDMDNDGDLDIVVSGLENNTTPVVYLYANNKNDTFTFTPLSLTTPIYDGSVTVGDSDNDGDLDLLLTGRREATAHTLLYRNDGNLRFSLSNATFRGVHSSSSSTKFGDYDNDGDLDIAVMGNDLTGNPYTMIYRNNGNNSFAELNTGLANQKDRSMAWGDYDNDGDLDLLVSGFDGFNDHVKLYRNEGNGHFAPVNDNFVEAAGACQWGDYDNDGDLDILLIGWDGNVTNHFAKIYRNENTPKNNRPAPPINLRSSFVNGVLTLSWDAATDQETPAKGLCYNLRVGTSSRGKEIMAPHANSDGSLMTPTLGNVQQNKTWVLRGLNPNLIYYWAVQAIDGCFAGSDWATAEATTSISGNHSEIPLQYSLQQNYPNPFNPSTRISFTLAEASHVRLHIYDITGQLIKILLDDKYTAGAHQIEWDGSDMYGQKVASGVYFYKLQTNKFEETRKMVLVQ